VVRTTGALAEERVMSCCRHGKRSGMDTISSVSKLTPARFKCRTPFIRGNDADRGTRDDAATDDITADNDDVDDEEATDEVDDVTDDTDSHPEDDDDE